jgi:hypothetical protein
MVEGNSTSEFSDKILGARRAWEGGDTRRGRKAGGRERGKGVQKC